jgi:Flp pilus assembly protein CpaB
MKSRGVVVVLALILATIATAGVFLYSQGVKQDAIKGGDLRDVIVSKVDIAANTEMDELIAADQFELLQVPVDAVVDGAVTDLAQLRGQRNTAFILAGEQIPISRVESGEIPGGVLGIPEGHQAISVSLDAPRAIAGALAGGDNVTIYATFEGVKINLVQKDFLKSLQAGNVSGLQSQGELPSFDTTVVLAPEVEVLRVTRATDPEAEDAQAEQQAAQGAVSVTLAFLPDEAQRFVFAMELGQVYLSLLGPDEAGTELEPLTFARVFLPEKTK